MQGYEENVSLQGMNTLGVDAIARYVYPLNSKKNIGSICAFSEKHSLPLIPLGAGSNVVFDSYVDAVIMPVKLMEKQVRINGEEVFVTLGAGCNWHDAVRWTLENGYYGLENLSLIPGTAGAAPVQNIGAYGVEIKDFLVQVKGFHRSEKKYVTLSARDCDFGYRDSVFKRSLHNDFVITEVTLQLTRNFQPCLEYPDIENMARQYCKGAPLTALSISDAVCHIRRNKLPDSSRLGNVGSFFKNPVIHEEELNRLRQRYKNIITHALKDGFHKVAAGWLIDACGLKGYRDGAVGTYEKQALVLVNHGQADGKQVLEFADMVRQKVHDTFNIHLEIEPFVYPCSPTQSTNGAL